TSGYGMGFQTAEFLSMAVSKQVRQSATGSQIVRGKTLRQARRDDGALRLAPVRPKKFGDLALPNVPRRHAHRGCFRLPLAMPAVRPQTDRAARNGRYRPSPGATHEIALVAELPR